MTQAYKYDNIHLKLRENIIYKFVNFFLSLLTIHYRIVEKGNLYDKYHEVVLKVSNLPPHNSTFYHKFDEFVMPKTEG